MHVSKDMISKGTCTGPWWGMTFPFFEVERRLKGMETKQFPGNLLIVFSRNLSGSGKWLENEMSNCPLLPVLGVAEQTSGLRVWFLPILVLILLTIVFHFSLLMVLLI